MTDGHLEAHGFPLCLDAIDGTHIEVVEPSEHHSVFINRKDCFSLNFQAVCYYKYCFQDAIVKWRGSVYDAWIFLNSLINGMLRKRISNKGILVEGRDPVAVFLLGDSTCPLSPFLMKEFSWVRKNER